MNYWPGILITALLLSACSTKQETGFLETFEKKKSYHQKLIKTEKIQLYENNLTKLLLTATYLGETKQGNERFIVGIYIDEDAVGSFENGSLKLLLNHHAPRKLKKLSHSDSRLKDLSFVSEWMDFYLVEFPHEDGKRLKIELISDRYGKGEAFFAKVAKYMLDKLKKKRPATF